MFLTNSTAGYILPFESKEPCHQASPANSGRQIETDRPIARTTVGRFSLGKRFPEERDEY